MELLDYIVLIGTLVAIISYGVWVSRKQKNLESYLKGGDSSWLTIGLSVMATQASAITFLSTPGLAFEKGMGFIQNYLGLPIALVLVAVFFIPVYYKQKVFTAFELLEKRFDVKTRLLTAFLFLVQRGLAAGLTIYAPAIILSAMLGWNLYYTIIAVGVMVIIYTVSGGSKAVSITQKWQMSVILLGMVIAFFYIISGLPNGVGMSEALTIASAGERLNAINFSFDFSERYTLWSGLTGGLFLALSYFGTDQSQVQRYLGGKSVRESKVGLMFNAILKIPMQFFILFIGVMMFVFYTFQTHPVMFNAPAYQKLQASSMADSLNSIEKAYQENHEKQKNAAMNLLAEDNIKSRAAFASFENEGRKLRQMAVQLVRDTEDAKAAKDSDYVFLSFIFGYLPAGLVGLLIAVIISAAMSSTAGELNALASTTTIDFYKRLGGRLEDETQQVIVSKIITTLWGVLAICFAIFASMAENLIEAVNILGSLFYGSILGIFLVALFVKFVKAQAVFIAAIISQSAIFVMYFLYGDDIGYLYYNIIGCFQVVLLAVLIEFATNGGKPKTVAIDD